MDDLPVRYRFGMGRLRHRQTDQQARRCDNCGISDRHGMRSPPRREDNKSALKRKEVRSEAGLEGLDGGARSMLWPDDPLAGRIIGPGGSAGTQQRNSSILATPVVLIGMLEHHGNSTDWRYRCAGAVLRRVHPRSLGGGP